MTPRIASLVPSLTELLVSLGLGEHIVARTGFCIHPAEAVARIPKVGGTKDVKLAKLRQLKPTHVLVNIDENRLDTVQALRAWPDGERPQIVVTHPCAPADNLALIEQMRALFGSIDGVAGRAAALHAALDHELQETAALQAPPQSVLYLIWRKPWMSVARDTYISRMLAAVRWQTLPAVDGGSHGAARYPVVHGDEPWLALADRLLLSSEPYSFDADDAQAAQALCPQARLQVVDGELVSWYGPRAVAGLRYLRELAQS